MNDRQERLARLDIRLHAAERRGLQALMVRDGYATLSEAARALLREGLKNHGFEALGLADIMSANLQANEAHN